MNVNAIVTVESKVVFNGNRHLNDFTEVKTFYEDLRTEYGNWATIELKFYPCKR